MSKRRVHPILEDGAGEQRETGRGHPVSGCVAARRERAKSRIRKNVSELRRWWRGGG